MNVYEWVESPDVREHLEKIHYEFTLPEAFCVVRSNQRRALEEKIAAWEELLATMPDCPFSFESKSGEKIEIDSFHRSARKYIEELRNLLEDVCRKDEKGVYKVAAPQRYKEGKGVALSEFLEENWKEFKGKSILPSAKIWKGKRKCLFFYVNPQKQVITIGNDHPLQQYWVPLPTPFRRGDILDIGLSTPVVLEYIGSWSEDELLENGLSPKIFDEDEDKTTGTAYSLFKEKSEDTPNMIEDILVCPLRLRYYRKPLEESETLLLAVSNYLKGNLTLDQMCMAYHVLAKEWEARALRKDFGELYDEDVVCAAGLEKLGFEEGWEDNEEIWKE